MKYYMNADWKVKRRYLTFYFITILAMLALLWFFITRDDIAALLEVGLVLGIGIIGWSIVLPQQISVIFFNKPVLIIDDSYVFFTLLLFHRKIEYKDIAKLELKTEDDTTVQIYLKNKVKPTEFSFSWISMTGEQGMELLKNKMKPKL